jgi:mannose-1-phosphate guanylyltransferase
MKAMVLCAGFGTRLRPLTDRVPKPLVPLCGLPLLRYNFALLKGAGVRDIVINTHHLGAAMEKGAVAIAQELNLSLQVSREEKQILGTGGGVKRAAPMLGRETFLVLNGDMIFDVDLPAAIAAHKQAQAVATMVLAPYPRGATYGAVEVDKDFNVRRIAGRGAPVEPGLTKMHFTGVHVVEPALLSRLPPEGESDINRTAYVRLIHDGAKVHGFLQNGYWGDLGAPRSLLKAHLDVLEGRVPLERFRPDADPLASTTERAPGVRVHSGAKIAPDAQLTGPLLVLDGAVIGAGARVGPDVVLGAGARVDAGAQVERSVVWDGTHVAPGERVIDQIAAPGVRLDA